MARTTHHFYPLLCAKARGLIGFFMINDTAFPYLKVMLDSDAMAKRFQDILFEQVPTQRVTLCQIERIKFKPGISCLISYRLQITNEENSQAQDHLLCAKSYPPGESDAHFAKTQKQHWVPTLFAASVIHVPDLSMVVWQFPNDRKLAHLPQLIDSDFLQTQILPPMIAANWGNDWQISEFQQQLVHYAPEHTCTVRLCLRLQQANSGHEQSCVLYGKTFYNEDGAETERLMQELWQSESRQTGVLGMARPLGYQSEQRFQWQLGLPGKTLLDSEGDPIAFPRQIAQAARVVATLHQSKTSCRRIVTLAESLTHLRTVQQQVAALRPEYREAVDALVAHLLCQAEHLSEQPQALLHGDLHLQNFLITQAQPCSEGYHPSQTIALIDLDTLALGSPWQDVGSFVAGLYYRGILNRIPVEETRAIARQFCQAYAERAVWPFSQFAVDWYTAAALLNQRIYRTIARLKQSDLGPLQAILDCAIQIAGVKN